MSPDDHTEPGRLTRIAWFFSRNWTRVVCATRGHKNECGFCARCDLPLPTGDCSIHRRGEDPCCEACWPPLDTTTKEKR